VGEQEETFAATLGTAADEGATAVDADVQNVVPEHDVQAGSRKRQGSRKWRGS
jgi:hypothetical protein